MIPRVLFDDAARQVVGHPNARFDPDHLAIVVDVEDGLAERYMVELTMAAVEFGAVEKVRELAMGVHPQQRGHLTRLEFPQWCFSAGRP
jgi:hypothetical protein